MPIPALQILESDALNAYASGLTEGEYRIAVTRGLMVALTDAEIEAAARHHAQRDAAAMRHVTSDPFANRGGRHLLVPAEVVVEVVDPVLAAVLGPVEGHVGAADEFVRILTEPRSALVKQYTALLATEGVDLTFTDDGVATIAEFAALVNEPDLVFFDEPTAGLDPDARQDLWRIVREVREAGATVVLTTHYMEEAEALCDRVAFLAEGRIVALDTPRELKLSLAARRSRAASTLLRWSRHSAADILRSFFDDEAILGPALATGPVVWGVSPEAPGTGLGALSLAMRHASRIGRPVGGSGTGGAVAVEDDDLGAGPQGQLDVLRDAGAGPQRDHAHREAGAE